MHREPTHPRHRYFAGAFAVLVGASLLACAARVPRSSPVGARIPALQTCYQDALNVDPLLKRKVIYTITINQHGRVTNVLVEHNPADDAGLVDCTISKIARWRFEPGDPDRVTFSVSFVDS